MHGLLLSLLETLTLTLLTYIVGQQRVYLHQGQKACHGSPVEADGSSATIYARIPPQL